MKRDSRMSLDELFEKFQRVFSAYDFEQKCKSVHVAMSSNREATNLVFPVGVLERQYSPNTQPEKEPENF